MSFQTETLKEQVDRLAKYILENFSEQIDNNGACDVAIKIMSNKATIKVVAKRARELTDLLQQHNALMVVHTKTVNEFADSELKCYELRKQNKDLRKLLKQATTDCKVAQESLDGAQREIERLSDKWELVVKRDLG